MTFTKSADGTSIAYEQVGAGPPVVIIGGALSTAPRSRPLAEAIAATGLRGVIWDRRARGGSGDTAPYAPEREVEDLRAVTEAIGEQVAVFGHSSGAVLALLAARSGVAMSRLFLSEPPLRFGVDEPPADLADRLQALVDAGRGDEAVLTFQRENVRLPDAIIEQFHVSPAFAAAVPLAQSTVYDTIMVDAVSQADDPPAVTAPTTVLHGDPADPMIVRACERLAVELPDAELVVVPESQHHAVDPEATARLIAESLRPA